LIAPVAKVLLVEDDDDIGDALARVLVHQGLAVTRATTGPAAVDLASTEKFDVVVLDRCLPGYDGLEVCRRIRAVRPAQLVLMLTALAEEIDVVVGLDAGADDYVGKPFRLAELLARIRALVRRAEQSGDAEWGEDRDDVLRVGDLVVDVGARRVLQAGEEIVLTPKEFDLLALLVSEAGRVISRERIIDEVWDPHWFGPTKTLDMHILSLRRKLGDHPEPRMITTVRGVGYRFERPGPCTPGPCTPGPCMPGAVPDAAGPGVPAPAVPEGFAPDA
jgi:DNA-binding response OmpR family regulator